MLVSNVHIPAFQHWFDHLRLFFQDLISDVDELRKICAELQTALPAGTNEDTIDKRHTSETPEQSENLGKNMGETHERISVHQKNVEKQV